MQQKYHREIKMNFVELLYYLEGKTLYGEMLEMDDEEFERRALILKSTVEEMVENEEK